AWDASFDGPVDDDDHIEAFAPAGYLEDLSPGPEEQLEIDQAEDSQEEQLSTALAVLDDRSKAIIERRWLTERKSTLQDLADEFGVSAERVRQIEQSAIGKMRAALEA